VLFYKSLLKCGAPPCQCSESLQLKPERSCNAKFVQVTFLRDFECFYLCLRAQPLWNNQRTTFYFSKSHICWFCCLLWRWWCPVDQSPLQTRKSTLAVKMCPWYTFLWGLVCLCVRAWPLWKSGDYHFTAFLSQSEQPLILQLFNHCSSWLRCLFSRLSVVDTQRKSSSAPLP